MTEITFKTKLINIVVLYKPQAREGFRAWVNYRTGPDKSPAIYDEYNRFVQRMRHEMSNKTPEIEGIIICIDFLTEKRIP